MKKNFKIFFISYFFCNINSVTDLQFVYSILVECEKFDKEFNQIDKKIQESTARIQKNSRQNPKKNNKIEIKGSRQEKNI